MIIKNKLSIIPTPVTGKHLERQTHLDYKTDTDTTEDNMHRAVPSTRYFCQRWTTYYENNAAIICRHNA
jgi:hypothetical protein